MLDRKADVRRVAAGLQRLPRQERGIVDLGAGDERVELHLPPRDDAPFGVPHRQRCGRLDQHVARALHVHVHVLVAVLTAGLHTRGRDRRHGGARELRLDGGDGQVADLDLQRAAVARLLDLRVLGHDAAQVVARPRGLRHADK